MKTSALKVVGLAVVAAGLVFTTFGETPATEWTYASNKLTEVVPEGQTPWVFGLDASGRLSANQTGVSAALNFRNLPEGCPSVVKLANSLFRGNKTIQEVYLPSTLKEIETYAFLQSSELRVCDVPEDCQLETIGTGALAQCSSLAEFRLTDCVATISGDAFNSDLNLTIIGSLMPDSLATITGELGRDSGSMFSGRLVFGGDDSHDVTIGTSGYPFLKCTSLTELDFGEKVTPLTSATSIFGSCAGITNIVCRNPDGFSFGKDASSSYFGNLSGLKQYDLYGWPKGKMIGNGKDTRILAPRDNAKWLAFVADPSRVTPWAQVLDADKAAYRAAFGEDALAPVGRVAATDQTYEGATLPKNVYVVFDKGEVAKTLFVKVGQDGADTPAVQPAFFPTCGTHANFEKDETLGAQFACTAPRYSGDGRVLYEVSGYQVCVRGDDGDFSVVAKEGTFIDGEAREFVFDTAEFPQVTEFTLVWKMSTEVAYNLTFVAPLVDGLGTWKVVTEPNFHGYYLSGSEVTVSATGAEGHPFVMWGIAEDMWNQTRYDATLEITVDGRKSVTPIFKADHWELHNVGSDWYLTDGFWRFGASYDSTARDVTITATTPIPAYGEELDFSLPVYYTVGANADGGIVRLTKINAIRGNWPEMTIDRLRRVVFGADLTRIESYAFFKDGSCSNLTEVVIKGAPQLGNGTFMGCAKLRRVICRNGVPAGLADSMGGQVNYAVVYDIPRENAAWESFLSDTEKCKSWRDCSTGQKSNYYAYHPDERRPLALTLDGNGTVSRYQWVRYNQPSGLMLIVR